MSKVAIVTGASRGIGYEICRKLANKKHSVLAVARSENALNELKQHNPSLIEPIPADLTDQEAVNKIAELIKSEYNGVDILINNAGALINKSFVDLPLEDWRSQIESNLISAVSITKKILPLFNISSHIINISSMGGFQGSAKFPGLAAYSVSKGALSILAECLAVELADHNIKVNALCLGAVQTDMLEDAFPGIKAPVTPKDMGEYIADFALNGHHFYNGKILPVALEDPD